MLTTTKIQQLASTSFVQLAHQGYNNAVNTSDYTQSETGGNALMSDQPIDSTIEQTANDAIVKAFTPAPANPNRVRSS